MKSTHLFELPVLDCIIPIPNGVILLLNGIVDLLCERSEQLILDKFEVETLVVLEGIEPFALGLTLVQHQCLLAIFLCLPQVVLNVVEETCERPSVKNGPCI